MFDYYSKFPRNCILCNSFKTTLRDFPKGFCILIIFHMFAMHLFLFSLFICLSIGAFVTMLFRCHDLDFSTNYCGMHFAFQVCKSMSALTLTYIHNICQETQYSTVILVYKSNLWQNFYKN